MSRFIRIARRSSGKTQREFAEVIGEHQSAIAAIESGSRGISLSHLERIFAKNALRLIPIPTHKFSICEVADDIYEVLTRGDMDTAFRKVIQLSDDLHNSGQTELVCLTATPPPGTGDVRIDSLLAGLCDYYLSRGRLPKPDWVRNAQKLPEPWFVDDNPKFHNQIRKVTPKQFSRLNIYISEQEFASV